MSFCESNPDIYFSDNPSDITTAKEGCESCPLKRFNACRTEGFKHEFGVFGGLSPEDRNTAPVVKANQAAANNYDELIVATRKLEYLGGDFTPEIVKAARAILMDAPDKRSAGIALNRMGIMHCQIGELLGVSSWAVKKWVVRANVAERAQSGITTG